MGILILTIFTLRRIRRQVVLPLNNLVAASERIERGNSIRLHRIPRCQTNWANFPGRSTTCLPSCIRCIARLNTP